MWTQQWQQFQGLSHGLQLTGQLLLPSHYLSLQRKSLEPKETLLCTKLSRINRQAILCLSWVLAPGLWYQLRRDLDKNWYMRVMEKKYGPISTFWSLQRGFQKYHSIEASPASAQPLWAAGQTTPTQTKAQPFSPETWSSAIPTVICSQPKQMPVLYETGQLWNKPNVMTVHWPLQLLWGMSLWKQHGKVQDQGRQRAEAHSTSVHALLWRKGLQMLLSVLSRLEGVASYPREHSGRQHRHGTLHQPGHSCPLCWNGSAGPGDDTCQAPKCLLPRGQHLPSIAPRAGLTAQFSKLWKKKKKHPQIEAKGFEVQRSTMRTCLDIALFCRMGYAPVQFPPSTVSVTHLQQVSPLLLPTNLSHL